MEQEKVLKKNKNFYCGVGPAGNSRRAAFSGVDFSGGIPYHRSILSGAMRCGKWSERDDQ